MLHVVLLSVVTLNVTAPREIFDQVKVRSTQNSFVTLTPDLGLSIA